MTNAEESAPPNQKSETTTTTPPPPPTKRQATEANHTARQDTDSSHQHRNEASSVLCLPDAADAESSGSPTLRGDDASSSGSSTLHGDDASSLDLSDLRGDQKESSNSSTLPESAVSATIVSQPAPATDSRGESPNAQLGNDVKLRSIAVCRVMRLTQLLIIRRDQDESTHHHDVCTSPG